MSTASKKRSLRERAFEELRSIRGELQLEVTSRRLDRVLADAEEVMSPRPPSPKKEKGKAAVLNGLDDLRSAVLTGINTKKDMFNAMGYWSAAFLLDFTMEQRTVICTALVEKALSLGVRPKPTWVSVLKNPMFFEEWSQEIYDGVKEGNDSLDEVAL